MRDLSQPEQPVPPGHVLRYTFKERLNHWVAALSYIYLLVSGLAFFTPALFWLAIICGGGPLARILHPWVGLVFTFAVCVMYVFWSSNMHSTDADKQWWKSLNYYITNQDEKMPPAGRYNAGQKVLFWSFLFSAWILLLSGVVLWFTEYIPWSFRWLRYAAVLVHPITALVTIANFMIHVYMSVFAERGAFGSVIRGDVSLAFAKKYHPGWYAELTGNPPPRQ